ncbi:NACHT domain-containing protein [Flavobacterium procerum]|uniref:NACHT domain-containing protein n=1 Tax=Flavobacterium procerum TaxID=1455569 RepID=A0ABV6BXN3_9FLAO
MLQYVISEIIDTISGKFLNEMSKIELSRSLKIYLNNTYEKFRLTKNLLFRNEPIDFYSNYIPLTLTGKNDYIRVKSPVDIFEKINKIAIIGNAGSGKTTLLKHLTLGAIESDNLIPVFVELRLFTSQNYDFHDYVTSLISQDLKNELKILFKAGKFLFLFDGFDEINFSEGQKSISQIQDFITQYNFNKFVITSRPGTNIESLNEFHIYEIAELNEHDIYIYVQNLKLPNSKKELFYDSIESDTYLHKYLTSPLFLAIYIDYILNHTDRNIPKKKSIFFRNIIDTLFSKHDSVSKLGFVRTKLSGLNKDQLEYISTLLAFRGLLLSTSAFSKDLLIKELELIKRSQKFDFENDRLIYDLTISVNILVVINDFYIFPHILVLEYLASLFISRLPLDQKRTFYRKVVSENKFYLSLTLLNFLFELDEQILMREYIIPKIGKDIFEYSDKHEDKILSEFIKDLFGYSEISYNFVNDLKKIYKADFDNDIDELFLT